MTCVGCCRGIAPGDKGRHDESIGPLAEAQRATGIIGDLAACRGDDRVSCGDIPFRRQISALPSAIEPNLSADPSFSLMAPGRLPTKASVLTSPCERLTAATQGSPGFGSGRVWIGSGRPLPVSSSRSRSAPRPTSPRHSHLSAGAPMMPSSVRS